MSVAAPGLCPRCFAPRLYWPGYMLADPRDQVKAVVMRVRICQAAGDALVAAIEKSLDDPASGLD